MSRPTVINIIKKRTAHKCGNGILAMASGYAMNISPGPIYKRKKSKSSDIVVVVVLLFYVHGKHLRSCRDGQLT